MALLLVLHHISYTISKTVSLDFLELGGYKVSINNVYLRDFSDKTLVKAV